MSFKDFYTTSSPKITTGDEKSKIYVLGVPFDFTTSYRPGSRFGPGAIRQAYWYIEIVDNKLGYNAEKIPIYDLGDLNTPSDVNLTIDALRKVSSEIYSEKKVLGLLGGEHLITYGSLVDAKDISLIVFDAHLDMRDELYGLRLSHATFLRRLIESNKSIKVYHVGSHAFVEEEIEFAKRNGVNLISAYDLEKGDIDLKEVVGKDEKLYVSLDLDVLDPSCAPGVANPEPEGLSYHKLFNLIRSLKGRKIIGFDVVELNPILDPSGITSIAAAKALSLFVILASMT